MLILLQLVLLAIISWMGMMLVHEAGHVLGASVTGGRVQRVVWHPLAISRTDVSPNPRALIVVWMGPIVGVALPLVLWCIGQRVGCRWQHLIAGFAGFCLIANGVYIGLGAIDPVGDAREMLRLGTPRWTMLAFGLPCAIIGLWMWHCASARWRVEIGQIMGLFLVTAIVLLVSVVVGWSA